jgi:hypothetical protein
MTVEDMGGSSPFLMYLYARGGDPNNYNYYSPGLVRSFAVLSRDTSKAFIRLDNATSGSYLKLVGASVTYPINAALYQGASGSNLHSYQWQSSSAGNLITYDATTACREATKSAYAKLKSDWGNNIRIYIIKYRKQPNCYQMPFWENTAVTISFDYSYLDNCASGSSAPYIHDVSTEEELKSALAAIVADLKSFAGYSHAKNTQ